MIIVEGTPSISRRCTSCTKYRLMVNHMARIEIGAGWPAGHELFLCQVCTEALITALIKYEDEK